MTVWHDKPPLSRRQARANARADETSAVPLIEEDPAMNIRPAIVHQPDGAPEAEAAAGTPPSITSRRAASRRRVQWSADADSADGYATVADTADADTADADRADADRADADRADGDRNDADERDAASSTDQTGWPYPTPVVAAAPSATDAGESPDSDASPVDSPADGEVESQASDPEPASDSELAGAPDHRRNRTREKPAERIASWFSSLSGSDKAPPGSAADGAATDARADVEEPAPDRPESGTPAHADSGPDAAMVDDPAADGSVDDGSVVGGSVVDGSVVDGSAADGTESAGSATDGSDESESASLPAEGGTAASATAPGATVAGAATMTRRELRVLRARAEAAGQPAPDVIVLPSGETTLTGMFAVIQPDPDPVVVPVADEAGVVEEQPSGAPGAPDGVTAENIEPTDEAVDESGVETPTHTEQPLLIEPGEEIPAIVESPDNDGSSASSVTGEVIEAELVTESEDDSARPPAESIVEIPQVGADAQVVTPIVAPAPETDGTRSDLRPASDHPNKPYGHWSTQAALDDEQLIGDIALSRDISSTSGAVTTHALVLPNIPESGDQLLTPLLTTGEVMVTGIVELPRSFGSTGAHPPLFDHPEVDALIDGTDREDANSAAAPVRATRAVSTASTRGMIETAPVRKSRLIPILLISIGAAVFLVAATAVVAGYFFNAF